MSPVSAGPVSRSVARGSRNPDPVSEAMFEVVIDEVPIGHFMECSGLQWELEVMEYPEGGENRYVHKLRGRAKFPNLVLKRGITHQDGLLAWLIRCQERTVRSDGRVVLHGPGATVRAWAFTGAFPVKWEGPTLNAGSNNVATETLEIAHHGLRPVAPGGGGGSPSSPSGAR